MSCFKEHVQCTIDGYILELWFIHVLVDSQPGGKRKDALYPASQHQCWSEFWPLKLEPALKWGAGAASFLFPRGGRAVPLKLRWEILCFLNVVAKLWKSFRMLESSWVVKVVITFATARRYVGGNVETVETIFQRSGNYCNLHGNRGIVKIK